MNLTVPIARTEVKQNRESRVGAFFSKLAPRTEHKKTQAFKKPFCLGSRDVQSESSRAALQMVNAGLFVFSKRKDKGLIADGHSATGRRRANINKDWL